MMGNPLQQISHRPMRSAVMACGILALVILGYQAFVGVTWMRHVAPTAPNVECVCSPSKAWQNPFPVEEQRPLSAAVVPCLTPQPQPAVPSVMVPAATSGAAAAIAEEEYIIPNVFHFVRFNQPQVTFVEMLSIMSVLRLNPLLVLIHCDQKPEGKFWDKVSSDRRLLIVHREPPVDIYGIRPQWIQHKSDLVRIQVLRAYGGIYLDNDCIMLRSIDHLRKGHKCVVAKSKHERYLGNMFAMAAMGCQYLTLYENLYKTRYNASLWYYNGGELPTTEILEKYPDMAHIVDEGIEMSMIKRLFIDNEPVEAFSSAYDVLHTFYNHRYVVKDTTDYNTVDYRHYNTSFANIARWLVGK